MACAEGFADGGAGDDFAIEFDGWHDFHSKTELHAETFQHLHVAGLAVAEAEIGADEDVLDVQLIDQDFEDKFFGGKAGEGVVEMEEHGGVEAGLLETGETLLEGGEHGRGFFGAEKLERMRVESDGAGDAAGIDVLIFVVHDGAENFLMAEMQAIEIADGEHGWDLLAVRAGAHGPFVGLAEDADVRGEGDVEGEAIVGEADLRGAVVRGEFGIGGGVRNIVTHVGEPRALRAQFFDELEGLLDGGVHGVGGVAEGVEDEVVEILQEILGGIRDDAEVGEIRGAAEAEAEHAHIAVRGGNGSDAQAVKGEGAINAVQRETGDGAEGGAGIENVREGALQGVECFLRGVDRERSLLLEIEGADVVEAEDVIGVAVGEENGVETLEAGAEGLVAEVGRGVDDHVAAGVRKKDGGAGAFVARIGGAADGAFAADGGHAHGGAGAEDGEAEGARVVGSMRCGHGEGTE